MYPTENVEENIANLYEFHDLYNEEGLYPHQELVRRFMSPYTPYKYILLYHSPGSGKSMICISISIDHYKELGMESIVVTRGSSSSDSFKKQIAQYLEKSGDDVRISSIFKMEHYISLHNKISSCSDNDIVKLFNNKIIVLDEVHNVRELGASDAFSSLMRLKKLCNNSKIILSTATPMVDNREQITSIEKLISSDINPLGFVSYNSEVRNRPEVVFMGNTYNDHVIERVEVVHMVGHQKRSYLEEESKESITDIYKKLTHIALFSCPDVDKVLRSNKSRSRVVSGSGQPREMTFIEYSVNDGYVEYLTGEGLRRSSCKYHRLLQNMRTSKGSIFVSIDEVHGSGLLLLSKILEFHGYELYFGQKIDDKKRRYTMCVGSAEICPNIQERLDAFNHHDNRHGSYIKVLLGSKVIGESITLLNVRQFHCMSPHWNYSKITQAVGRVVRSNSHSMLRRSDRNVEIYLYVADNSIDCKKMDICKDKQVLIEEEESSLISRSIERHIPSGLGIDTDNFILYYADRFEGRLVENIRKLFVGVEEIEFGNIYGDLPKTIVADVLYRMVTKNIVVRDNKYLREDCHTFFLTDNVTSPLEVIRHPEPEEYFEEDEEEELPVVEFETERDCLKYLRRVDLRYKIALLEGVISRDDDHCVRSVLKYSHINYRGICYHSLYYRDLRDSYRSVLPFPNVLTGKTRKLVGSTWKYVENEQEEDVIISLMRKRYDRRMGRASDIFAIISIIDNKMRIRRGGEEEDRRKTLKGRNIDSMKKSELFVTLEQLGIETNPKYSVKDMESKVEDFFISNNLYVYV
jgi:hypothetical protein